MPASPFRPRRQSLPLDTGDNQEEGGVSRRGRVESAVSMLETYFPGHERENELRFFLEVSLDVNHS